MKKLIPILLLFLTIDGFSQCDPSTFVFSISPGVTQSGAIFGLEGGIWPIAGKVGVMAGPMMYDEKVRQGKEDERLTYVDFAGRVIYKVTEVGSSHPQLVTAFATVRGLLGVSYRAYWSIGQFALLGVEPMYVNRLGAGVNLIFTARL